MRTKPKFPEWQQAFAERLEEALNPRLRELPAWLGSHGGFIVSFLVYAYLHPELDQYPFRARQKREQELAANIKNVESLLDDLTNATERSRQLRDLTLYEWTNLRAQLFRPQLVHLKRVDKIIRNTKRLGLAGAGTYLYLLVLQDFIECWTHSDRALNDDELADLINAGQLAMGEKSRTRAGAIGRALRRFRTKSDNLAICKIIRNYAGSLCQLAALRLDPSQSENS